MDWIVSRHHHQQQHHNHHYRHPSNYNYKSQPPPFKAGGIDIMQGMEPISNLVSLCTKENTTSFTTTATSDYGVIGAIKQLDECKTQTSKMYLSWFPIYTS
jgi:hypothetical protein